jgi:hypothetical protein
VFGALLLEQRKVMIRLAGEEVVRRVIAGLPAEQREEYEGISLLSWCRHSTATEVTVRVGQAIGKRPEVFQAEVVRAGVERTIAGPWRVLLRLASDEALVKRTALLYSKTCDRGRLTAEPLGPGHVQLTLSEWPDAPDLAIVALAAGVEAVLRSVGRKATVTWARKPPNVVFEVWARDAASSNVPPTQPPRPPPARDR